MRLPVFLALFLIIALPAPGQTAANSAPGLPKEPREVFAAAAPFYDFTSPELKPWHLKATYQLYDDKGKPSEQGTYEYWWASPQVYRTTWTRPGATRTEWYTADGKHLFQATGGRLKYFERELQSALLSPLPGSAALDQDKTRLDLEIRSSKGSKIPCIAIVPAKRSRSQIPAFGFDSTYCFDPHLPVLISTYAFGTLATKFNNVAKFQGRFLAREILIFGGERKLFSATVDTVGGLAPSDPALTPAPDAALVHPERIRGGAGIEVGHITRMQAPVYPPMAKARHEQGTVIVEGIIGIDGKVHDLEMISAPSESLAAAALAAASQWEYTPYTMNGKPIEVETTIALTFQQ